MKNWFSSLFIACTAAFFLSGLAAAQDFQAVIKIDPASANPAIEGKFLKKDLFKSPKNFAFIAPAVTAGGQNSYERISALNLTDAQNREITVKKLIDGEYLAEKEATGWNYEIDLSPPGNFAAKAHISWLENGQGILMLRDLLPQFAAKAETPLSARIEFELPENWKIITSAKRESENTFFTEDFEKAVFVVGENWRESEINLENFAVNFAFTGKWRFSDEEAAEAAREILDHYRHTFGAFPRGRAQIALVPLENKFGRWEGETRGNTLTIISGDMPFQKPSLQRLHEQFRHELLHLWIPNGLSLEGNYDWFYEGFAVYQSLRSGVAMNRISFNDFLDTLAQARSLTNFQNQQISLLEASKTRKSGANPQVYARGMLIAFLCDAALLRKSGGKRSISEIFRQVYQTHRLPNRAQDGNIAVSNILKSHAELRPVVENFVEGAKKIDWTQTLETLGIEEIKTNSAVKLKVKDKPSGRQKDLLDELGYNNWRKIRKKSK